MLDPPCDRQLRSSTKNSVLNSVATMAPANPSNIPSSNDDINFLSASGLSKENKKLAQIIINAVTASMERQFSKEREVLESRIADLETQVQSLQDRQDDLENYGRRNTIIISGPSLPCATTNENCIDTATELIVGKLELSGFNRTDIDVAHRLGKPRPGVPDKRSIIVKLCRRENKNKIFQACRIKKPQNIFFTESVSRTRSTILYVLRRAKRDFPEKFGLCKTEDGNVRVLLPTPGDPSRSTRETVNTKRALDTLLRTLINRDSSSFEVRWGY